LQQKVSFRKPDPVRHADQPRLGISTARRAGVNRDLPESPGATGPVGERRPQKPRDCRM
jgi:hypothetical protein